MRPSAITVNRNDRQLIIKWQDGVTSVYPFDGLRAACPCVTCKGGHANMGGPPDPCLVRDAPDTGLQLQDVQQVGGYALQFQWSDSHNTGIYTWETLRLADPARCEA